MNRSQRRKMYAKIRRATRKTGMRRAIQAQSLLIREKQVKRGARVSVDSPFNQTEVSDAE